MATIDIADLYNAGSKQVEFVGRVGGNRSVSASGPFIITPPDDEHFIVLSFLSTGTSDPDRAGYNVHDGKRMLYNNVVLTNRGFAGTPVTSRMAIGRQWNPLVYSDVSAGLLHNPLQMKPPVQGYAGLPITISQVNASSYQVQYEYEVYKYV